MSDSQSPNIRDQNDGTQHQWVQSHVQLVSSDRQVASKCMCGSAAAASYTRSSLT